MVCCGTSHKLSKERHRSLNLKSTRNGVKKYMKSVIRWKRLFTILHYAQMTLALGTMLGVVAYGVMTYALGMDVQYLANMSLGGGLVEAITWLINLRSVIHGKLTICKAYKENAEDLYDLYNGIFTYPDSQANRVAIITKFWVRHYTRQFYLELNGNEPEEMPTLLRNFMAAEDEQERLQVLDLNQEIKQGGFSTRRSSTQHAEHGPSVTPSPAPPVLDEALEFSSSPESIESILELDVQ